MDFKKIFKNSFDIAIIHSYMHKHYYIQLGQALNIHYLRDKDIFTEILQFYFIYSVKSGIRTWLIKDYLVLAFIYSLESR